MTEPATPTVDQRVRAAIDAATLAHDRRRVLDLAVGVLAGAGVSLSALVVWPTLDPLHVALTPIPAVVYVAWRWAAAERAAHDAAVACDVVEVETPHGTVYIDPNGLTS